MALSSPPPTMSGAVEQEAQQPLARLTPGSRGSSPSRPRAGLVVQALGEGLAAHPPTGAVLVDEVAASDAGPALCPFRRRGMRKCDVVELVVAVPRIELEAVDAVRGLQCLQLPWNHATASGCVVSSTALNPFHHRRMMGSPSLPVMRKPRPSRMRNTALSRAHEDRPGHHRASPGVELVDHGARVRKAGTVEAHAVVLGPQVVDDDEPGRESGVQHSLHVVEYARLRGPVGHLDPRVVLRPVNMASDGVRPDGKEVRGGGRRKTERRSEASSAGAGDPTSP